MTNTPIEFHNILDLIGGFGRWQIFFLFFANLSCFYPAMNHIGVLFLAAELKYNCSTGEPHTGDQCWAVVNDSKIPCIEWTYDHSDYISTLISEWDLICDRIYLVPIIQSSYFIGVIFGCLLAGALSDAYGRRPIILILAAIHVVSSYSAGVSRNFWAFLFFRLFIGSAAHGSWSVVTIFSLEIVPPSKRAIVGLVLQLGWKIGFSVIAGLSYFIRDWKWLQISMSTISLTSISFFWVMIESPRWLIANGRIQEAEILLKKIGKWNNVNLHEEAFSKAFSEYVEKSLTCTVKSPEALRGTHGTTSASDSKGGSKAFFDNLTKMLRHLKILFTTPVIKRRMLIIMFPWFVVGMSYYGIVLSVKLVDVSKHLFVIITGLIDLPFLFFYVYLFNKVGRIPVLIVSYGLCGLFGLAILGVPESYIWIRTILILIGKTLSGTNFQGLGLLGPELFPTSLRNEAFSFMDACSKVGSTLAPFAVDLLALLHYTTPNVFFGIFMILGMIPFLFLPETLNKEIPETIQDVSLSEEFVYADKMCLKKRKKEMNSLSLSS